MKLDVGASTQTVTVTDAPPLLDASNATLGGTIENELYSNLPLAARDSAALQRAKPGPAKVPQAASAGTGGGIYGGSGLSNQNANGAQSQVAAAPLPPAAPPPPATSLDQAYLAGAPVSTIHAAAGAASTGAATDATSDDAIANIFSEAKVARGLATLPSKLPTRSVVSNARLTLVLDTAGALFRSDDGGVTWHSVAAQWQGHALTVRLASPRSATQQAAAKNTANAAEARQQTQMLAPPAAAFELTTDSGAVYSSSDGQTWQRK